MSDRNPRPVTLTLHRPGAGSRIVNSRIASKAWYSTVGPIAADDVPGWTDDRDVLEALNRGEKVGALNRGVERDLEFVCAVRKLPRCAEDDLIVAHRRSGFGRCSSYFPGLQQHDHSAGRFGRTNVGGVDRACARPAWLALSLLFLRLRQHG